MSRQHYIPPPDPPIESSGHWALREEFFGHKSFGYFVCSICAGSNWISAHAFKNFKQGCKRCNIYCLPVYMWVNEESRDKFDDDDEDSKKKPHKTELCEACRLGKCKNQYTY